MRIGFQFCCKMRNYQIAPPAKRMETFLYRTPKLQLYIYQNCFVFYKKSTSNAIFLHIKSGNKTILSHQSDIGI